MLHAGEALFRRQIVVMRNALACIVDRLQVALDNAFHVRKCGTCQPECWCQVAEQMTTYFKDGTMSDKYELEMAVHDAKRAVVGAAMSLEASRIWFELNPGDPYGDAQVELHDDLLDDALNTFFVASAELQAAPW